MLEMDEESGFRVCEGQGDAAEAASRVRTMLHDLHLLTTAVEACWRRLNTALDTYMQVRSFAYFIILHYVPCCVRHRRFSSDVHAYYY